MESATSIVKKSECGNETVHRFEPDVVGIHVIGFFQPSAFTAASASARVLDGFGADEGVFAVGLVPDRNNLAP